MLTVIRCSKLSRYMYCAGYAYIEADEPEAGDPAKEGTACGEYLQRLLERKPVQVGQQASNGWYYDEDMKFYAEGIAADIFTNAASEIRCEQRIDWQTRSGIWIKGSYDASYVDHRGRLCIDDLKYGWGIVDVVENWQLLGYAIGEVIRRGQAFREIVIRIRQPRPHHEDGPVREWVISYPQLLEYKERIENRMLELANGRSDLQTGSHCKYCKGAGEACPAFSRLFYSSLEVSMDFRQDNLTNEEIAKQLDQAKRAAEVIKIKLDSLEQLGTDRIKKGQIIPGYIQTNKYTQREWKHGVTAESLKTMTGKVVIETSMISPAKAEKMGISKKLVEQLSSSRPTGVKLEKKNASVVGNKAFGNTAPTLNV